MHVAARRVAGCQRVLPGNCEQTTLCSYRVTLILRAGQLSSSPLGGASTFWHPGPHSISSFVKTHRQYLQFCFTMRFAECICEIRCWMRCSRSESPGLSIPFIRGWPAVNGRAVCRAKYTCHHLVSSQAAVCVVTSTTRQVLFKRNDLLARQFTCSCYRFSVAIGIPNH